MVGIKVFEVGAAVEGCGVFEVTVGLDTCEEVGLRIVADVPTELTVDCCVDVVGIIKNSQREPVEIELQLIEEL